jgi:hypothetical protein
MGTQESAFRIIGFRGWMGGLDITAQDPQGCPILVEPFATLMRQRRRWWDIRFDICIPPEPDEWREITIGVKQKVDIYRSVEYLGQNRLIHFRVNVIRYDTELHPGKLSA